MSCPVRLLLNGFGQTRFLIAKGIVPVCVAVSLVHWRCTGIGKEAYDAQTR